MYSYKVYCRPAHYSLPDQRWRIYFLHLLSHFSLLLLTLPQSPPLISHFSPKLLSSYLPFDPPLIFFSIFIFYLHWPHSGSFFFGCLHSSFGHFSSICLKWPLRSLPLSLQFYSFGSPHSSGDSPLFLLILPFSILCSITYVYLSIYPSIYHPSVSSGIYLTSIIPFDTFHLVLNFNHSFALPFISFYLPLYQIQLPCLYFYDGTPFHFILSCIYLFPFDSISLPIIHYFSC